MNKKINEDNALKISMIIALLLAMSINGYIFIKQNLFSDARNLILLPVYIIVHSFFIFGFIYGFVEKIVEVIRNKKISINNYLITGLITFGFLFYAVICQPSEYGCYQVLRWLVSVFSAWTSVKIYQNSPKSFWLLLFAALTIIFDPVLTLKFEDDTWAIIDIITLAIFFIYCVRNIIKNMEQ